MRTRAEKRQKRKTKEANTTRCVRKYGQAGLKTGHSDSATVTAKISGLDLILYIIVLLAENTKLPNLVASENHARIPVYVAQPLQYEKFHDSVRKFTNARARNSCTCKNFCDYSIDIGRLGRRQEEPPPPEIDLDGYERFIVEDILDHRRRRGELQFLVRWKGYFDATWELESNLKNEIGQDLVPLALYRQKHPH